MPITNLSVEKLKTINEQVKQANDLLIILNAIQLERNITLILDEIKESSELFNTENIWKETQTKLLNELILRLEQRRDQ